MLLCAPSNVAVDNLLERLVAAAPEAEAEARGRKVRAIRLGHPARQSPAVLGLSLDHLLARADGMNRPGIPSHN